MSTKTPNFGFVKPEINEFYDVNVQNENWDKLDEELKKAGSKPILLTNADDLNQITANGYYYWRLNKKPANVPTENDLENLTAMRVWSEDGVTCIQEITDMYSGATHSCVARRTVDGDECYPWEWVNPPMEKGVEYRTVERYEGEPVFVTLNEDGFITKRTDYHGDITGATQTYSYGTTDLTAGTSDLETGKLYFVYE